jgi:predicted outer membrane repeat protein
MPVPGAVFLYGGNFRSHTFDGAAVGGGGGGAIYIAGVLALTYRANRMSGGGGGAMTMLNKSATLNHSFFAANEATYGGAIYVDGGSTLTMTACPFHDNSAGPLMYVGDGRYISTGGGAIYVDGGSTLTMTAYPFQNNSAGYGGALSVDIY